MTAAPSAGSRRGSAPVRVFLALGANLGDRRANLERALERLAEHRALELVGRSRWHETEAVGGPANQPPYLNGVAELRAALGPLALLHRLQEIERDFGRRREQEVRHGPRTLDLDLLLYGFQRLELPELVVPHPRLAERAFVLEPLAELAPELVPPGADRTVAELLAGLEARP